MMTRQDVGRSLAAQLHIAESALDEALREAAILTAMLPKARFDARLSAVTGQRAFEEAAATVEILTQARGRMVRTHHRLALVASRLKLDSLTAGPVDKPEDSPPVGSGPRLALEPSPG